MFISNLRDPDNNRSESLNRFLSTELRTRQFHPQWIKAMQEEGYAVDCSSGFPLSTDGSGQTGIAAWRDILNREWFEEDGRYRFDHFPRNYRDYLRHLSRELRFLVDKDLLSTDNRTVLFWKTDAADANGIVPKTDYIKTSAKNNTKLKKSERKNITNENHGLRYTIRTNGLEVIMTFRLSWTLSHWIFR